MSDISKGVANTLYLANYSIDTGGKSKVEKTTISENNACRENKHSERENYNCFLVEEKQKLRKQQY